MSPKLRTAATRDGLGVKRGPCVPQGRREGVAGEPPAPRELSPTLRLGVSALNPPSARLSQLLAGDLTGGRMMQADTLNGPLRAIFFTCLFALKWERRREGPGAGGGWQVGCRAGAGSRAGDGDRGAGCTEQISFVPRRRLELSVRAGGGCDRYPRGARRGPGPTSGSGSPVRKGGPGPSSMGRGRAFVPGRAAVKSAATLNAF